MWTQIEMASDFCGNHRTFDRFSSRAVSLQRLGYERNDIQRLLHHTKEEWRRDNVHMGFNEQVYPYHCEMGDDCGACRDAYHARRKARFTQSVQAFADLYAGRGWLEFQHLTIPPFAPKPEYVRHVLHDTPETEEIYQAWLSEYLASRVQKARESLERCIERWREVGRRRPVPEKDADGNPVTRLVPRLKPDGSPVLDADGNPVMREEFVYPNFQDVEYETVPIRFPKSALRFLPKDLLSQREIQNVYAIITNQVKTEELELVAAERGFAPAPLEKSPSEFDVPDREFAKSNLLGIESVGQLFQAAPAESHSELADLLSDIALARLRELKASGEFSERVKAWFARSDMMFQLRLESEIGFTGGELSELLAAEVHDAWLHACWRDGMMQSCVRSARVYIPLKLKKDGTPLERVTKKDGQYCVRQEYGPRPEPQLNPKAAGVVSLPEDCPVWRMPKSVLTEMLALYRNRLRHRGIQFRYIQVYEAGTDDDSDNPEDEHHHIHCVIGFHEHQMPHGLSETSSTRASNRILQERYLYRRTMQRAWHAVSGNIIWRRGAWSEAVREIVKAGNYMGKYMAKEKSPGRRTWVSHNLGLKRYVQERRLVAHGFLPEREPDVQELEHGGFAFAASFTDAELESAGATRWVGLTRIKKSKISNPPTLIPQHFRVDAVCESTEAPSVGTAAGVVCVHRNRGVVDVIPRVDVWLPVGTFYSLCHDGLQSKTTTARLLFRELSLAFSDTTGCDGVDFHEGRHNPEYAMLLKRQFHFGRNAYAALKSDFEELASQLSAACNQKYTQHYAVAFPEAFRELQRVRGP